MNRMNRLSRLGLVGLAVTLAACGGDKSSTGGGTSGATSEDVEALRRQVQELKDDLEKEKAYLRKYFATSGKIDTAAYAYWSRLADAVCDIEKRVQGLPPVGHRMCPDDGGGPDKIAPPPYPPQ